jgi:deazaflavin-dependent oxidoreductase (nitroreductase family)
MYSKPVVSSTPKNQRPCGIVWPYQREECQVAARLLGFGILTHVGRKSGRVYRTPVKVFRAPKGFLIALTYGRDSEWLRNVLAAGGCKLETRGVQYQLSSPIIVHDPNRRRFPIPVRIVLRLIGADDFMQLSTSQLAR